MAEPTPHTFILCVCTSIDIVRKMTLASRPTLVDNLKTMMKEKFKLEDCDFSLQYEDPDFDGQLCSLVDIEELPQEAVLKVIRSESDASSTGTDDTEHFPMCPLQSVPVPNFSYEVHFRLREGNTAYETTGKTLKSSRVQKHDILENLAGTMHSFKAYPNDREVSMAAEELVSKHPFLRKGGSDSGGYGCKNSLKFKMGNYRTKLSRAGYQEVGINAGKRSRINPEKEYPHSNIKRPKRADVNFLPNFPQGEDPASLELLRLQIKEEVKKMPRNLSLIKKRMQTTFALRREEIVNNNSPVREFLECLPALGTESQVESEADVDTDTPVALLTLVNENSADPVHFNPKIAVVLESAIVSHSLPRLSDAFLIMFRLIYALHLSYPKELTNTFDFIQNVLMGSDDGKLKPRVQSLKNEQMVLE